MSRPFTSPSLSHDRHLRQLLDERAARSDRLPQSDSPSVYGGTLFSLDSFPDSHADPPFFNSPFHSLHYTESPRSSSDLLSPDTPNPAKSMLDLTDDHRSSFASSFDDKSQYNEQASLDSVYDEDDDPVQRMSMGPKMRFHGRAPWEVEDQEDEESQERDDAPQNYESTGRHITSAAAKKIFHLRSPSTSTRKRRSIESFRSQDPHRLSTDSPRRPLSRSTQYSQDTISVASVASSARDKSGRAPKFSLSQLRQHLPGTARSPSVASNEPTDSSQFDIHTRALYSDDAIHPYANPDLVNSYVQDQSRFYPVTRTSSAVTVTEPLGRPNTPAQPAHRAALSSEMSGTTAESAKIPPSPSRRKEISSPLLINRERFASLPHSDLTKFPGWNDKPALQTFSLISLEEAQAQRARGGVASVAISSDRTNIPFPERDADSVYSHRHSPTNSLSSSVRGRAVSAGAKTKHSMVGPSIDKFEKRDTDPLPTSASSKSLKHKKSGFMRLFNSSKDKDASQPPLPVSPDSQSRAIGTGFRDQVPEVPALPEVDEWAQKRGASSLSINTQPSSQIRASPSSMITNSPLDHLSPVPPLLERDNATQSAPAKVSEFPTLRLRPVSGLFSAEFPPHIVDQPGARTSFDRTNFDTPKSTSSTAVLSPLTPMSSRFDAIDPKVTVQTLKDHFASTKLAWQRQVWELEGQVRDLKAEVEELRSSKQTNFGDNTGIYCDACGRGKQPPVPTRRGTISDNSFKTHPLSRPRARTGSSRLGNGLS